MSTIVIETHHNNGIEWGVSFNGSNPKEEDYIVAKSKEDAFKLHKIISTKLTSISKIIEIKAAITRIGLSLNACNNTVTTDIEGEQEDETHWRINNNREIRDISMIEGALMKIKRI